MKQLQLMYDTAVEENQMQKENLTQKENEIDRLKEEIQSLQDSFEEVNKELAEMQNKQVQIEIQRNDNLSHPNDEEQNNTEDNSKSDDETNEKLKTDEVRNWIKELKDMDKKQAAEEEDQRKRERGMKILRKDFIRHGRKEWNNKLVEEFLKRLIREENYQRSKPDDKLIHKELIPPLLDLLKMITQLKESTMDNRNEINTAVELIKTSKVKYLPLQQAINPYVNEVIEKLENIQDQTIHLIEDA